MKAQRAKRFAAASAIGVLLASGATIATAGTATAAAPSQISTGGGRGCFNGGWWGNCGYGYYGGYGFNNGFNNFFPYGYGGGFNTGSSVIVIVA
ncbi:hypothetical protein [Streptomyces sp. NPDC086787]|uniref:hypothetical protein n=1 Tax=Streptomyces sp. NPDC086787 TaxID=3365759 RepID=UPI003814CEA4